MRIKNPQVEDEGIYTCKAYVISTGEVQSRDIEVEISSRKFFVVLIVETSIYNFIYLKLYQNGSNSLKTQKQYVDKMQ